MITFLTRSQSGFVADAIAKMEVNFFNIIMRFLYDVHKMSAFKAGRFCSYV
jgi:hypothetical protein